MHRMVFDRDTGKPRGYRFRCALRIAILGDEKEDSRGGVTSRHAGEHGEPCVEVQESWMVEGGKTARVLSLRDT